MSTSPAAGNPTADLLPARMVNEFVHRPRLFYDEHVEGVFLHDTDTERGASEHSRGDAGVTLRAPRGAAPLKRWLDR